MKIKDVHYDVRGDGKYWLRINGYWVMKSTFLCAYAAIHENWDSIDWSLKQTAKSMVGNARWGAPEERGFVHALGRSVKYFMKNDMLPLPLEVARKRNGEPYKGGSVQYVRRGSNSPRRPAVTTRSAKRVGSIDPRALRISLAS
jgi:hypothetical protein